MPVRRGIAVMAIAIAASTVSAAVPTPAAEAFPLSSVRLLDGPFKRAMQADQKYLLALDADRLLIGFRENAGRPTTAPAYGGWESRGLRGQTLGHYLSACALMYAATGDERFREKVTYCVDELAKCQADDGFLGGMPDGRKIFQQLRRGNVKPKSGFDLNGAWVPWYNQHKLFAGLRDAAIQTGNVKAKAVLVRLADWCGDVVGGFDDKTMQAMLAIEHGGMMETLADVYAMTGEMKYLTLAEKFWHKAVLDPLAADQDKLTGLHANTNIPKVIGAARLYELTGDPKYAAAATHFWTFVTANRSFVTGSNSDREHFFPADLEAKKLGPENGETCNVYNMLKLTSHLARWTGVPTYYDFYERATINHVLGSIDPDTGMCTYFQSLEPGRFKVYGTPEHSFWCCTGTGLENHARYAADAYTHAGPDTLDVNLFVASELTWKDRGLTLRQETAFPETDRTKLTLTLGQPTRLKLRIRIPAWAESGIDISGVATAHAGPGSGYVTLDRTWQNGDTIDIRLPMTLAVRRAKDDATMATVVYGPVVLAAQLGRDLFPATDNVADHVQFDNAPVPAVPLIVSNGSAVDCLKPVDGRPMHFKTDGVGRPNDIEFAPLYSTHHQRYGVYMRWLDPAQYADLQKVLAKQAEAKRVLDARTVDSVAFGEQQPEVDHDVKHDKSTTGQFNGHSFRDAAAGGYFSARVTLKPGLPQVIRCTYWGSDNRRTFDILIDGTKVATQTLARTHPESFFDADYPLPDSVVLAKKESAVIEFRPHAGSTAGGVFGLRILLADGH